MYLGQTSCIVCIVCTVTLLLLLWAKQLNIGDSAPCLLCDETKRESLEFPYLGRRCAASMQRPGSQSRPVLAPSQLGVLVLIRQSRRRWTHCPFRRCRAGAAVEDGFHAAGAGSWGGPERGLCRVPGAGFILGTCGSGTSWTSCHWSRSAFRGRSFLNWIRLPAGNQDCPWTKLKWASSITALPQSLEIIIRGNILRAQVSSEGIPFELPTRIQASKRSSIF